MLTKKKDKEKTIKLYFLKKNKMLLYKLKKL